MFRVRFITGEEREYSIENINIEYIKNDLRLKWYHEIQLFDSNNNKIEIESVVAGKTYDILVNIQTEIPRIVRARTDISLSEVFRYHTTTNNLGRFHMCSYNKVLLSDHSYFDLDTMSVVDDDDTSKKIMHVYPDNTIVYDYEEYYNNTKIIYTNHTVCFYDRDGNMFYEIPLSRYVDFFDNTVISHIYYQNEMYHKVFINTLECKCIHTISKETLQELSEVLPERCFKGNLYYNYRSTDDNKWKYGCVPSRKGLLNYYIMGEKNDYIFTQTGRSEIYILKIKID